MHNSGVVLARVREQGRAGGRAQVLASVCVKQDSGGAKNLRVDEAIRLCV